MVGVRATKRARVLGATLVTLFDVALVVIVVTTFLGSGASPSATSLGTGPRTARVAPMTCKTLTKRTRHVSGPAYHPLRVTPPETAVERTVDEALIRNTEQPGVTALLSATLPAPAVSATFPAIDAADSETASLYAVAFTQELLDLDFASSSRVELVAWVNYNNAPFSLGDLPEALSTKVLVISLGERPSPLPTPSQWAALARARTRWHVSGLVVSVNPAWTQALSAGWVPVDPLMAIYDVSGTLTVTTPGRAPVLESIAFALTLGGATLHPGYGAVALNYWTVN